jgi:hypothetical protein
LNLNSNPNKVMKNFLVCFLIALSQMGFAQKKYHLDYALEFEIKINTHKIKNQKIKKDSTRFYIVNAKENNFILFINEDGGKNYNLFFSDKEGLFVNSSVDKNLFSKAETINNECESVRRSSNPYKFQVDNYEFINLSDTLVNNTSYYHYTIKTNRGLKYQKRKKIVSIHYIVDKNSPDFSPFFIEPTCYEEWKKERNIPNGKPFIIYHENYKGEITFKMQLENAVKIDRYFTVPDECDYTKI